MADDHWRNPPPPPRAQVTIVGKNETCHWENSCQAIYTQPPPRQNGRTVAGCWVRADKKATLHHCPVPVDLSLRNRMLLVRLVEIKYPERDGQPDFNDAWSANIKSVGTPPSPQRPRARNVQPVPTSAAASAMGLVPARVGAVGGSECSKKRQTAAEVQR